MKEKSAPTALVVIIASVVIILLVFGYASSKVKAQKPEYMPITSQTQLSLDKDVSTGDASETIVENGNTSNSGTVTAPNNSNTGSSGNANVVPPSMSGPSINDAFGDILWQEK